MAAAFRNEVANRQSTGTVTYSVLRQNMFTVSGVGRDGRIYYERVAWGPGAHNTLMWTYDAALKSEMDDVVAHTAASFTDGAVGQAH